MISSFQLGFIMTADKTEWISYQYARTYCWDGSFVDPDAEPLVIQIDLTVVRTVDRGKVELALSYFHRDRLELPSHDLSSCTCHNRF